MAIRIVLVFLCAGVFLVKPVFSQENLNLEEHSIVFLFDVSDSVKKNDRENYFKNLQQILNAMSAGDDFVALKIGQDSQLLNPIASGIFPRKEKGMASGYYENTRRKVVNGAIRQVGNFLNNTTDHRTSIISSFIAANDYFASKAGKKKYVFIFSDMIEASSYLNMERTNEYPVKRYVNISPNNLKDAKIYIIGVNAVEKKFEKVKKFWISFVEQYESKVAYYQYSLTNFSFD